MADSTVNIKVKTTGAEKAERGFKKLGTSLAGMAAGAVSVGLVAKALVDLNNRAGLLQGVERAFIKTGISIEKLREATRGTVTDFELMQKAVQAKNLGVPIEQLATLFKFASIRARETGENVDYLVDSIVTGIGRKSVLILDNLGISAAKVQENFKKTGDFAQAVADIVNEDMAGMDENIGSVADSTDRLSSAFGNLYDEVAKVLAVASEAGGIFDFFADLTDAVTKYVNFWYGDGSKVFGQTSGALIELSEGIDFPVEEFTDYVAVWATWATTIAEVQGKMIGLGQVFDEVAEIAVPEQIASTFQTTAEQLSAISNQLLDTFDYVFTETLIREQNFGDAMVAGFTSMLERMVAQLASRAAVFGVLNLITGGSFGVAQGFLDFVTAPITGVSPAVSDRGGSTTNINMPNVTMINSRSIGYINQALTRHRRLH